MKHLFVRMAVVVLVVATVFGVAPQASAQDGTPSVVINNLAWDVPCSSGSTMATFTYDYISSLAPGYKLTETWYGWSASLGTLFDGGYEFISSSFYAYVFHGGLPVPSDGYRVNQIDIYAPDGTHLSTDTLMADCTTGELWGPYADVYGINEPAADKRVMGNVLVDTPVYSEPSPTAALKPVLKAGQTWFIVGQTTGTDGALWYKVFVGGKNYGFVPASTMAPQGPVPGAK
ncbi:MAG TPA: hypothetical protein VHP83_10720 [Aggregatilineaceae bacterium]|nr:hypothetical protein [Aggregatilineaceae bacterium]